MAIPSLRRLATRVPSGEVTPRSSAGPGAAAGTGCGAPTAASLPLVHLSDADIDADPAVHVSVRSSAAKRGAVPGPTRRGVSDVEPTIQTSACGGSGSDVGFDVAPRTNATAAPADDNASCVSSWPSSPGKLTICRAGSPIRRK
jgi:hypothetical protein